LPRQTPFAITGFSFGGMVAGHIATLLEGRITASSWSAPAASRRRAARSQSCASSCAEMPARTLAAEARRKSEILMFHDPAKVDAWRSIMQILNTTRPGRGSRDMGQAFKLSEVLPRVKTPLIGSGRVRFDHLPPHPERIRSVPSASAGFRDELDPGAGHWVAYEAADAFIRSCWGSQAMKTKSPRSPTRSIACRPSCPQVGDDGMTSSVPDRRRRAIAVPLRQRALFPADLEAVKKGDAARSPALDDCSMSER